MYVHTYIRMSRVLHDNYYKEQYGLSNFRMIGVSPIASTLTLSKGFSKQEWYLNKALIRKEGNRWITLSASARNVK